MFGFAEMREKLRFSKLARISSGVSVVAVISERGVNSR